jgi:8-amino-7-oxononanoate synthase
VRLLTAVQFFRDQLQNVGISTIAGSTGPIVPVVLHDPHAALALAARLEERGFLVGAIRPPTVPRGTSRLRIVVTAAHQNEDLVRLTLAIRDEAAVLSIAPRSI